MLVKRFLQLVTRDGLFIIWEWDLDYKDKAIVSDSFAHSKVVNMVCLIFAGLIVA